MIRATSLLVAFVLAGCAVPDSEPIGESVLIHSTSASFWDAAWPSGPGRLMLTLTFYDGDPWSDKTRGLRVEGNLTLTVLETNAAGDCLTDSVTWREIYEIDFYIRTSGGAGYSWDSYPNPQTGKHDGYYELDIPSDAWTVKPDHSYRAVGEISTLIHGAAAIDGCSWLL